MNDLPEAAELPGARPLGPKVVHKTILVLGLFTPEQPEWTVTAISRTLSIPLATTHRLLRALVEHRYVAQTPQGRYRLGTGALDLGQRALASVDLRSALRPVLRRVAAATNEAVLLAVYDDDRHGARTIDRLETTHTLRLSFELGTITPLHAGANSKAMLAHLDRAVLEDTLNGPLEPLTPKTIVDARVLREEIAQVRASGWAFSYEETDLDVWGVSAPILLEQRLLAVLGIAAPTSRYSDEWCAHCTRIVVAAAKEAAAVNAERPADQTQ